MPTFPALVRATTTVDPPCVPAVTGTHHIAPLRADYTAGDYDTVRQACRPLLADGQPVAVDIETFGLGSDARRLKCVALADKNQAVVLDPREEGHAFLLRRFFAQAPRLIFHNSPFDVPNLHVNGLFDLDWCAKITDTLIYARLAYPAITVRKTLEALSARHLGIDTKVTIEKIFRMLGLTKTEGFRRMDIDTPIYLMSNAADAVATARLLPFVRQAAYDKLTTGHPFTAMGVSGDEAWRLVEREQRINRMMLRRACVGLKVDFDFLDQYRETNNADRYAAEAGLTEAGVRPGNAGDLITALQQRDALPPSHPLTPGGKDGKNKKPSTKAEHLELLSDPIAQLFVRAKEIAKIEDDYLQKVIDLETGGRIHPVLKLLAATHGRASMADPPVQQFPELARGIVLFDEDHTSLDWKQIEPVFGANVAQDSAVLGGYDSGMSDLYDDVARLAVVPRKVAKVIVLALMYGEGLDKMAAALGLDYEGAKALRGKVWRAMPKTTQLLFRLKDIAGNHGMVFTMAGRIVDVPMGPGFKDKDTGLVGPPTRQTHKGPNYFCCGGAYDILAETLISIDEAGLGDAVSITMHDEIVCATSAAHDIDKIMQTPPERFCLLAKRTPVLRTDRADLGTRWDVA